VDLHGEDVLARCATVLGIWAETYAVRTHEIARVAAGHQGIAVVFDPHSAVLR
jgi:hypothetical protein